jgi:hypothetical protein
VQLSFPLLSNTYHVISVLLSVCAALITTAVHYIVMDWPKGFLIRFPSPSPDNK